MSDCPTIRSSVCCPSDNANTYGYKVGDNTAPPHPIITCPGDFNGWTTDGEYEVPDFTGSIEICAYCQEREDLIITQEPPAGTIVTAYGGITIVITVTDTYGQTATCSFIITINEPPGSGSGGGGGSGTTPTIPPWVYTPFLFAYWSANDTLCDELDDEFPCFFRSDLSAFLGNPSPHHLTNGGGGLYSSLSPIDGFPVSPGPIFNRGSFASNNATDGYFYHADNTAMRLLGKSFTVRGFFRLVALDAMESWQVVGKFSTLGYRIIVHRPDASAVYTVTAEIDNGTSLLTVPAQPFTLGDWIYFAMAFDATLGQLRFYIDGLPAGTDTLTGFALAGEASQFSIGSSSAGSAIGINALACWTLNDTNWRDSINGYHLTAGGSPSSIAGHINNAAQLTGSANLSAFDATALRLNGTDFTVRLWIRIPVVPAPGTTAAYLHKWAGNKGWSFGIESDGVTIGWWHRFNSGVYSSSGGNAHPIGAWHHVLFTWVNATSTFSQYVNNVLVASTGSLSSPAADGLAELIMSRPSANIDIDEAAIWTRALSAGERATDYNGGTGTSCPSVASTADIYSDEIGIWLQAWSDARVAADYAIMEPFLT